MNDPLQDFQTTLSNSFSGNTFVKLSLAGYNGMEEGLKGIQVKRILIKKEQKLSFTYRYKTRDIVKNYSIDEALPLVKDLVDVNGFRQASLFTLTEDIYLEFIGKDNWQLKQKRPSHHSLPSLDHDQPKVRKIESTGKQYLYELKITDAQGEVYKRAQDKYRQINHYIEILSSLLKELPARGIINVVDMGAGKGYLTFALYDYLTNVLNRPAKVIGVEFRRDLVELCNVIANKSNFNNLTFIQGTIEEYEHENISLLIALHACDTATDDAIAKGIKGNADLIVVSPCCHKQIRREMENSKVKNDLDFIIQHGIYLERQAEMVTDGLRALMLEYSGYHTKIVEFISDTHTSKNTLIIGQKRQNHQSGNKAEILNKISQTKAYFGIKTHYLEKAIGLTIND